MKPNTNLVYSVPEVVEVIDTLKELTNYLTEEDFSIPIWLSEKIDKITNTKTNDNKRIGRENK